MTPSLITSTVSLYFLITSFIINWGGMNMWRDTGKQVKVHVHFVCVCMCARECVSCLCTRLQTQSETIHSAYFGRQRNGCGHPDFSVSQTLLTWAAIRIRVCWCLVLRQRERDREREWKRASERTNERASVRARARPCVCGVCVCVRERESARERERARETVRDTERESVRSNAISE